MEAVRGLRQIGTTFVRKTDILPREYGKHRLGPLADAPIGNSHKTRRMCGLCERAPAGILQFGMLALTLRYVLSSAGITVRSRVEALDDTLTSHSSPRCDGCFLPQPKALITKIGRAHV